MVTHLLPNQALVRTPKVVGERLVAEWEEGARQALRAAHLVARSVGADAAPPLVLAGGRIANSAVLPTIAMGMRVHTTTKEGEKQIDFVVHRRLPTPTGAATSPRSIRGPEKATGLTFTSVACRGDQRQARR